MNHLDPNIDGADWTEEEKVLLFKQFELEGNKWKTISKNFPGRPHIKIKNRFFSHSKRIYREINKLQKGSFDSGEISAIKPKILHEFFLVKFEFIFKNNIEIEVSVKDLFFSYFKNFKDFPPGVAVEVKERIFEEILKTILSVNEDYKKSKSNERNRKFLKNRDIKIELDMDYKKYEQGKNHLPFNQRWCGVFVGQLDEIREEFRACYFRFKEEEFSFNGNKILMMTNFNKKLKEFAFKTYKNVNSNELIEETLFLLTKLSENLYLKLFKKSFSDDRIKSDVKMKEIMELIFNLKNKVILNRKKKKVDVQYPVVSKSVGSLDLIRENRNEVWVKKFEENDENEENEENWNIDNMSLLSCDKNRDYGEYNERLFDDDSFDPIN